MPVMDIDPMTSDLLLQRLESYQFYPDDKDKRDAYYYVNKHKSFQENIKSGDTDEVQQLVPVEELKVLIHSKPFEAIKKESDKRYEESGCVGLILILHLYMKHTLHESAPSIRKCVQQLAKDGAADLSNSLPTTEQSYWNYWKRYRSVRHLCAGRVLTHMLLEDGKISGPKETIGTWLSLSDSFLRYGTSYFEPKTSEPLIQDSLAWTFPDWLNYSPIDVTSMPMNFPFVAEFLKSYRCQDYVVVEK